MTLHDYHRRRDFHTTPEPQGSVRTGKSATKRSAKARAPLFVVQKHRASALHYDLRLEVDNLLASWVLPKGPSLDPRQKRLAIPAEDHPLAYADFEGVIPEGQYGAGPVIVWDRGSYQSERPIQLALREGLVKLRLQGHKLRGRWMLLRTKTKAAAVGETWLLVKERDEEARPGSDFDILDEAPASVISGRSLPELNAASFRLPPSRPSARRGPKKRPPSRFLTQLSQLRGAVARELPDEVRPALAVPYDGRLPQHSAWLHEIKYDGYRIMSWLSTSTVAMRTRNGLNWAHRFPYLARTIAQLPAERAILDGEVVSLMPSGASNFAALQQALATTAPSTLVYYVFDLLYLDGFDLRGVPLRQRKQLLTELLATDQPRGVLYSDHFEGDVETLFPLVCERELEGIVSKRADGRYVSGRTDSWRKRKCLNSDEFIIGGFTESADKRRYLRAILLGTPNDKGELQYVGQVGSGFSAAIVDDLRERLKGRAQDECPFAGRRVGALRREATWVRPELVAEVQFGSWTPDGRLRHPVFKGLREDKGPGDIGVASPSGRKTGRAPDAVPRDGSLHLTQLSDRELASLRNVTLTNPDRILYPEHRITKYSLVRYYAQIADWILPFLRQRLVSLLRCPDGYQGECFFQKHHGANMPGAIHRVMIEDDAKSHLTVSDLAGLIGLVQIGSLELHVGGSRRDRISRPDWMVFDLDPGPEVPWSRTVNAAGEVRDRLQQTGLQGFAKTSGGKGIHVVVPLQRRQAWQDIRTFASTLAHQMTHDSPGSYTLSPAKDLRQQRIYLDTLRNSPGATTICPYSTRARYGAPVSTPVTWSELPRLVSADQFNLGNLAERLAHLTADPWEEFRSVRQSLGKSPWKQLRAQ